jgi:hypothetical protein
VLRTPGRLLGARTQDGRRHVILLPVPPLAIPDRSRTAIAIANLHSGCLTRRGGASYRCWMVSLVAAAMAIGAAVKVAKKRKRLQDARSVTVKVA